MNWTEDYVLTGLDYKPKRRKQFTVEKRNKYGAVSQWIDGYYFKSKKEARRYGTLKTLQMAKEISELKVHPKYPITINGKEICNVELDFSYKKDGNLVVEDTKGMDLPISKLKRKMVNAVYGFEVVVL